MKTKLFTLILAVCTLNIFAADLIVEEFGLSPAYSSISAALTAANDGDRIFIKNRTGNIPWVENLTITKSVELLSFQADTFFVMQGSITVTPAAAGKKISIIGMYNTSGSITTNAHAPAGSRTTLNIASCELEVGSINFSYNNFDTHVISNNIKSGSVTIRHGNVIGNTIASSIANYGIYLYAETGTATVDTAKIVGNNINNTNNGSGVGIYVYAASFVHYRVLNNFIKHSYIGIEVGYSVSYGGFINQIYNNTIVSDYSSTSYNIQVNYSNSGAIVEIMNNVMDANGGGYKYGISLNNNSSGAQINVYYNHFDSYVSNMVSGTATVNTNNTNNTSFTIASDGKLGSGCSGIDGANPSPVFYDLDLTVGDAGAWGGSNSLENYQPVFAGSARVYHVEYPRNVRQGSSINIKAQGFDR